MLLTYIKLSVRSLLRKKGFAAINLLGISLGMATTMSIAMYIAFEVSYDTYHRDADAIYRVIFERTADGEMHEVPFIPSPVANELLEISGVTDVVRLVNIGYQNNSLIYNRLDKNQTLELNEVYYADSTIADVITLPMETGSVTGLRRPNTILLASTVAQQLFGDIDPVGQTIAMASNTGSRDFEIIGVFKDLPANTDFNFSVLISMVTYPLAEDPNVLESTNYWQNLLYVRLDQSPDQVQEILSEKIDFGEKDVTWNAVFYPLTDVHFERFATSERGNWAYVRALGIIGLFILLIAWVNYINLSTSRAMERSKEVGIRKVLGSAKMQLAMQFITESLVLNILAALIAFTLVQLLKPMLIAIANPMTLTPEQAPYFWGLLGLIILVGAILAGAYPAFVMTSLNPASILSGRFKRRISGQIVRKGLIILQFSISVFLLIGTFTVYKQIHFMRTTDLGINIDNHLVINSPPGSVAGNNSAFFEAVDAFRNEVSQFAFVESITGASSIPGEPISWGDSKIVRKGDDTKVVRTVSMIASDMNYFDVYDIDLIAGRNYMEGDNTFGRGDIVINATAVKHFGFESPEEAIGEQLEGGEMFPDLTIIGVTADYHHTSLRNAYSPILYVLSAWNNYYTIELNLPENAGASAKQMDSMLEDIGITWEKFFPDAPFDFFFADQAFDKQYNQDEKFGFLFGLFTILAILLAILGLVGMVSYEVVQRNKEIGIRKVLGASIADLIRLLTGKYLLLVFLSGLISIPFGYWLFGEWLNGFAFRIDLSPIIALLAFGSVMFIALLVSGYQVLTTSIRNPVHSIKDE